jgi:AcrR family transcriptional regulator
MSLAGLPPAIKRRARQREEARRAILDASEAIVLDGGFEALSIRRLSTRCGYAAPTIYHYFRDKPAIVDALLEERCRRLVSALRRVRRGRGPLADAHALYGAFARFGRAHPAHYRLLTARRDPGLAPPAAFEEARVLLEQPLHELEAAGQLVSCSVETAGHAVFALLHGLVSLGNDRTDMDWAPELFDAAFDCLLRGFGIAAPEDAEPGAHA